MFPAGREMSSRLRISGLTALVHHALLTVLCHSLLPSPQFNHTLLTLTSAVAVLSHSLLPTPHLNHTLLTLTSAVVHHFLLSNLFPCDLILALLYQSLLFLALLFLLDLLPHLLILSDLYLLCQM